MSLTRPFSIRENIPAFARKPATEPVRRDPTNDILEEAPSRIAAVHRFEAPTRTFREQFEELTRGADDLVTRHNALVDSHRATLTENEILRAQNVAERRYSDDLKAYWEERYSALEKREGRLQRLYTALAARLDVIVETIATARAEARQDMLSRDDAQTPSERLAEGETIDQLAESARHLPINQIA